jgi:hypothetical protein
MRVLVVRALSRIVATRLLLHSSMDHRAYRRGPGLASLNGLERRHRIRGRRIGKVLIFAVPSRDRMRRTFVDGRILSAAAFLRRKTLLGR